MQMDCVLYFSDYKKVIGFHWSVFVFYANSAGRALWLVHGQVPKQDMLPCFRRHIIIYFYIYQSWKNKYIQIIIKIITFHYKIKFQFFNSYRSTNSSSVKILRILCINNKQSLLPWKMTAAMKTLDRINHNMTLHYGINLII